MNFYSKFLSLINGAARTVDLSNSSNVLELGGGLQLNGSSSGDVSIAASASTSTYSLVLPSAQAANAGYVLANDGTGNLSWANPSSGSVTSVALTLPTSVFSVSGSPVTSSGTLAGSFIAQSANTVFAGPSSGSAAAPTFRDLVSADIPAINLASSGNGGVSGILPMANGGTGQSSSAAAFAALSPLTTAGDIIYENSTPAPARLPIGSSGQILTVVSGLPAWAAPATDGTVTSVAFADDSTTPIYSVSGSPVTSAGTLAITLENQSANRVFAGPSSGSATQPAFRALAVSDIPSLSSLYLPLSGGTMSGAINMGGYQINDLGSPSISSDAATKGYVDAAINGLTWKGPVNAYANSNVPLTGSTPLVIDGYTVANGNLVLLGNQTTASQNGEYTAAVGGGSYTLTANGNPTAAGDAWLVLDGTVYANSAFVATAAVPSATFVEFAGPDSYVFNSPLSLSGNTVSLNYGNGLTLNSGNLIANLGNGLEFSGSAIVVEAADSSINVSGSGIKVAEDAAGAIVTGGSGIKVQVLSTGGIQISSNSLALKFADASLQSSSSGASVQLASGGALSTGGSGISALVDGSTIGINGSNELYVLNGGITATQISSSALSASGALSGGSGTQLSVNVDNSTIDISSNQLQVKAAGISATQLATGAFDQATIAGGAGTAAHVIYAPSVQRVVTAGQTFSANTTYALRWGNPNQSETAGRVYAADISTSTWDKFHVIGLFNSPTSISVAGSLTMVVSGPITLGSSDTDFAGTDQGLPVWLGSAGAYVGNAAGESPGAGNASVKLGMAESASVIWVEIQIIGVN